jgi:hypothetical protein
MSDITGELEKAIWQAINYDPFVKQLAPAGVYLGAAPPSADYPGVVIDLIWASEKQGRVLGNGQLDYRYLYGIKAAAITPDARQVTLAIMKAVHEVMNDWRGTEDVDVYDCKRSKVGRAETYYSDGLTVTVCEAHYEMLVRA